MFSIKKYCKTCGTHWSSTTQPKYNKPLDRTKQSYRALKNLKTPMVAPGSQYIQLFTSSPYILHLILGQKKKQTPSSAPLPAFSRPALGWMQHRLGIRLASHPSEGGKAALTQLMLYPLPQGEKAAPPTAFSPAFRPPASGR